MTDNQIIYHIYHSRYMSRRWQRLSMAERRRFIEHCKPIKHERQLKSFYDEWRIGRRLPINGKSIDN